MTEIVAKFIVKLAQSGMHDVEALLEAVLKEFTSERGRLVGGLFHSKPTRMSACGPGCSLIPGAGSSSP